MNNESACFTGISKHEKTMYEQNGGTKGFIRFIAPIPALTLEHIESMCASQVNFSSIPKHVYLLIRGTGVLFINIGVLPILLMRL